VARRSMRLLWLFMVRVTKSMKLNLIVVMLLAAPGGRAADAASSRTALRQAAGVLPTVSESDPDYSDMRRRIESENRANFSAEARLGRLFLAVPRAVFRVSGAHRAVTPFRQRAGISAAALDARRHGRSLQFSDSVT
jgi:hypothetical protein